MRCLSYALLLASLNLSLVACTIPGNGTDNKATASSTPTTVTDRTSTITSMAQGMIPTTPIPTRASVPIATIETLVTPIATPTPTVALSATWTVGTNADWERLRQRPLQLSTIAVGDTCPRNAGRPVASSFGPALGDGKVYAVGFGAEGVARYGGAREEDGWFYQKVLWIARPDERGPILIRGQQLDGPNELRFEWGADPAVELQLPAGGGGWSPNDPGWRAWPSYTRVRAPGCYAWQVDGLDFTEIIVFQAMP